MPISILLPEYLPKDKETSMQRLLASLGSACVLILFSGAAIAEDLIETAANSSSFKIFLSAVKAAGLTESLKNSGPYTVFAPTDEAFGKLSSEEVNALLKDKPKLTQVLTYHMVQGKILNAEVKPGKLKTVQGSELTITSDNGKVTVDNANVIESDKTASNGVIHAIDTVLMPK